MGYFNDIHFISADVSPNCLAQMDRRFRGTYSLEFLLTGRMYFGIDGGEQIELCQPAAFWHHPVHTYQYGAVDGGGWHHHFVQFSGPRGKRMLEQGILPLAEKGYLPVPEPTVFSQMFTTLADLIRQRTARSHAMAVVQLERMIAMLDDWASMQHVPQPYREGIDLLAEAMRTEPNRPYDFRREARSLGLSYSYFRRLFRKTIGRSPHDFLLYSRMQWAAGRLTHDRAKVRAVAVEMGYDDPAQFSKLFKSKIGISPSQYRQMRIAPSVELPPARPYDEPSV